MSPFNRKKIKVSLLIITILNLDSTIERYNTYTIYVHITIMLEMLLPAIVSCFSENSVKCCRTGTAAASAVVDDIDYTYIQVVRGRLVLLLLFVIVCRMTQRVAVVYRTLFQCFFFCYSNTIYLNILLNSAIACTASTCLQSHTSSKCHASPKMTGMRGAKGGGSPLGEALRVCTTFGSCLYPWCVQVLY